MMMSRVAPKGSEPNFRIYRGNSEVVGENWGPTPGILKFELPGSDPSFRHCFQTSPRKVPKPGSDPLEERDWITPFGEIARIFQSRD